MTAGLDSFERLQARLQALPQELQDTILEYTCTVTPSATNSAHAPPAIDIPDSTAGVYVDEHYRPPPQLSSPRVRELYAKSYYSTTVFNFTSRAHLVKWLVALPSEHRAWLVELRYHDPEWREGDGDHDRNQSAWNELLDLEGETMRHGILLRQRGRAVIYMKTWDFEQECWSWWNGEGKEESLEERDKSRDDREEQERGGSSSEGQSAASGDAQA